jgi:adenylosuccinate lyase
MDNALNESKAVLEHMKINIDRILTKFKNEKNSKVLIRIYKLKSKYEEYKNLIEEGEYLRKVIQKENNFPTSLNFDNVSIDGRWFILANEIKDLIIQLDTM